ncbi:MAG TPA: hypothetical protein VM940_12365, partial [Chthoniobacterales bacterium]|nr:hypothetical protein [Chthoniobacterales bacterium]
KVSKFAIVKPSGNVVVDESVAAIAQRDFAAAEALRDQAPSSRETSNLKFQRRRALRWCLMFGASLVLGA